MPQKQYKYHGRHCNLFLFFLWIKFISGDSKRTVQMVNSAKTKFLKCIQWFFLLAMPKSLWIRFSEYLTKMATEALISRHIDNIIQSIIFKIHYFLDTLEFRKEFSWNLKITNLIYFRNSWWPLTWQLVDPPRKN